MIVRWDSLKAGVVKYSSDSGVSSDIDEYAS